VLYEELNHNYAATEQALDDLDEPVLKRVV
jgi:hypothetical protein